MFNSAPFPLRRTHSMPSAGRRAAILSLPWLLSASGLAAAGDFGFNYWPQGYSGCTALSDAAWPDASKKVAADLGMMKSLGAKTLRLTFYMESSGYQPGLPVDPNACNHLPDMLNMIESSGFEIVIAYSNTYLQKVANSTQYYWQLPVYGYGSDYNGFWNFMLHSKQWINRIAEKSGASQRSSVIYYDLQNEYDRTALYIADYFRAMYGDDIVSTNIPVAKRGISVLNVASDFATNWYDIPKQLEVMGNATLSHIDYHSYPVVPSDRCPSHWDISAIYTRIHSAFNVPGRPIPRIVLGEFGRRAILQKDTNPDSGGFLGACGVTPPGNPPTRYWDEPAQADAELAMIAAAKSTPVSHYLHWSLWDNAPPTDHSPTDSDAQVYGFGYGPNAPKDVIGVLAAQNMPALNLDMEETQAPATPAELPKPKYWTSNIWAPAGTSLPSSSLFASHDDRSLSAATGKQFARLVVGSPCAACVAYLQSYDFPVTPGAKVYVNAYLRSNMKDLHINLVQLDANGNILGTSAVVEGKKFTPYEWSWNNYLARIHESGAAPSDKAWSFNINSQAASRAFLTIGGTPILRPSRLDVDTISISVSP